MTPKPRGFYFCRGTGIIEFAATIFQDPSPRPSLLPIRELTMPQSDRKPIAMRPVRKVSPAGVEDIEDALAVERWLRITLNGREVAALMCSPGHEEELGAGFALTQGFIRSRADLLSAALRSDAESGDTVRIVIPVELSLSMTERATARGVCGGDVRLDADLPVLDRDEPAVAADVLERMARTMTAAQKVYKHSGGTHAAGVFTAQGEPVVVREDVGRHNALDKALGHCVLSGRELGDKVVVITGRASREIVTKAAWAGVPILASVSAATVAGADAAERARLTLVSFLRGRRMNICAHPQRIDTSARS
jgi:FdhD protein